MNTNKFKKDDKVRVLKGMWRNEIGTVRDGHWRISASDWPEVLVVMPDLSIKGYDEEDLELLVEEDADTDDYEYSMAEFSFGEWKVVGDLMDRYNRHPLWRGEEVTRKMVGFYKETFPHTEFKLVKRRKAGEVEDV